MPDRICTGSRRGPDRQASAAVAVLALALVASLPLPALADLKICNATSSRIGVSVGYPDAKGWTTEGWWNIAAQSCETLLKGTLTSRYYYIHAVDYDRGGEWAGSNFMCTADKVFTIRGEQDCQRRGYKRTGFFMVDTNDAKDWTIRLTEPGEQSARTRP